MRGVFLRECRQRPHRPTDRSIEEKLRVFIRKGRVRFCCGGCVLCRFEWLTEDSQEKSSLNTRWLSGQDLEGIPGLLSRRRRNKKRAIANGAERSECVLKAFGNRAARPGFRPVRTWLFSRVPQVSIHAACLPSYSHPQIWRSVASQRSQQAWGSAAMLFGLGSWGRFSPGEAAPACASFSPPSQCLPTPASRIGIPGAAVPFDAAGAARCRHPEQLSARLGLSIHVIGRGSALLGQVQVVWTDLAQGPGSALHKQVRNPAAPLVQNWARVLG